ncbi:MULTISPECIES: hypothetical protein [unclassified Romboutsia]|uniref:hypothetical protein n=1 Tax=unclassified Romboutsia TaxID=2626894 RepID=UPI0008219A84|nr:MULTISPECIES: hypothetical protein [unclassified Romboutsia]SCH65369.1 Uncharacterised protein [uncultured Clostridium sp.]
MNSHFSNYYTEALGAIIGVFTSLYAYLNGWMYVYGNINRNFDSLSFGGVIASYFLLPLCVIMLILSAINTYTNEKYIFNIPISTINKAICIITVIIGLLGAKAYFLIPSIFILFNIYKEWFKVKIKRINEESVNNDEGEQMFLTKSFSNKILENDLENVFFTEQEKELALEKEIKTLATKKVMALELLEKKSDPQFIMEITGLTLKEIQELKKQEAKS